MLPGKAMWWLQWTWERELRSWGQGKLNHTIKRLLHFAKISSLFTPFELPWDYMRSRFVCDRWRARSLKWHRAISSVAVWEEHEMRHWGADPGREQAQSQTWWVQSHRMHPTTLQNANTTNANTTWETICSLPLECLDSSSWYCQQWWDNEPPQNNVSLNPELVSPAEPWECSSWCFCGFPSLGQALVIQQTPFVEIDDFF